jgi:hypothetical protein
VVRGRRHLRCRFPPSPSNPLAMINKAPKWVIQIARLSMNDTELLKMQNGAHLFSLCTLRKAGFWCGWDLWFYDGSLSYKHECKCWLLLPRIFDWKMFVYLGKKYLCIDLKIIYVFMYRLYNTRFLFFHLAHILVGWGDNTRTPLGKWSNPSWKLDVVVELEDSGRLSLFFYSIPDSYPNHDATTPAQHTSLLFFV